MKSEITSILKYLFFSVISCCFLCQCATMQSPTGGEKDVFAPIVLSTKPIQGATNVNPTSIEIQFDEYFKLKNLQSELLISPPIETKPIIYQKGKSLFITLLDSLNENSTYTFNFGKGIADYHEGNVLKDFALVFSTGNELDSLSLSGKLHSCPANNLPENIIVGIYQKDSLKKDSTIYLQKPAYFGLLNEYGEYKIEHVRAGNFELIAFEDVNANYRYDGATEQIAFCDSLVKLSDSTTVDLWLFEERKELKLLDVLAKESGRIHWVYNQNIDSFKIHSKPETEYFSKLKEDSILIWPNYSVDSFYIWTEIDSRLDSVLVKTDTLKNKKLNLDLEHKFLKASTNLIIQADAPITGLDTSRIAILLDSIPLEYSVSYSDFELMFEFPHEGSKNYKIELNKGAVKSVYNNKNDSINLSFYTKSNSKLAGLNINVNSAYKNFYIELLKDNKVIGKCTSGEKLNFTKLVATKYQLRLVLDENQDGKWTPGNYSENKQPEKVFYYPEEINLRANWELEIDF